MKINVEYRNATEELTLVGNRFFTKAEAEDLVREE